MNLDEYRTVFVAGSLVLMLIAATPTVSLIMVVSSGGGERFSELWLLGPNHMAEDYPSMLVSTKRTVFLLALAITWAVHRITWFTRSSGIRLSLFQMLWLLSPVLCLRFASFDFLLLMAKLGSHS